MHVAVISVLLSKLAIVCQSYNYSIAGLATWRLQSWPCTFTVGLPWHWTSHSRPQGSLIVHYWQADSVETKWWTSPPGSGSDICGNCWWWSLTTATNITTLWCQGRLLVNYITLCHFAEGRLRLLGLNISLNVEQWLHWSPGGNSAYIQSTIHSRQ